MDHGSIQYHAKIENLKRMAREVIIEANLDVDTLEEKDLMNILQYFDSVCGELNEMDDSETKIHYLLKLVIVNSALVIMKHKEIEE